MQCRFGFSFSELFVVFIFFLPFSSPRCTALSFQFCKFTLNRTEFKQPCFYWPRILAHIFCNANQDCFFSFSLSFSARFIHTMPGNKVNNRKICQSIRSNTQTPSICMHEAMFVNGKAYRAMYIAYYNINFSIYLLQLAWFALLCFSSSSCWGNRWRGHFDSTSPNQHRWMRREVT